MTEEGTKIRYQGKIFHLKYNCHIVEVQDYLTWAQNIGGKKVNKVLKYSFGNELCPKTGSKHCHVLLKYDHKKDIASMDHFTHPKYGKCHMVQVKTLAHFLNCAKYCKDAPRITNITPEEASGKTTKQKELPHIWQVWNAFVSEVVSNKCATAIGHTHLLIKRPNSQMTYMEKEDLERFYDAVAFKYASLTSNFDRYKRQILSAVQWNETVEDMMTNQVWNDKPDEYVDREQILNLPRVKLHYDIIEFKDFFYSVYLNKIFINNSLYPCYYYCPSISIDTMYNDLTTFIQEGYWTDILKRQNLLNISLLIYLSNILKPREFKALVLYLLSGPNAGKTTLLKFLGVMYPPDYICYIGSEMSPRFLARARNAGILVFEEANALINSSLYYDIFLKLLEGSEVPYDEKFGQTGNFKFTGGIVMTGNYWRNDEFYSLDKKALSARIQPVNMTKQTFDYNNNKFGAIAHKAVTDETGLVILFLGLALITDTHQYSEFMAFPVSDSPSADDQVRLKLMRNSASELTTDEVTRDDNKTMSEIMKENDKMFKLAEVRASADRTGTKFVNLPPTRAFTLSCEELGIDMTYFDQDAHRKIHRQKIEEAKTKHDDYIQVDDNTTTVFQSKAAKTKKGKKTDVN